MGDGTRFVIDVGLIQIQTSLWLPSYSKEAWLRIVVVQGYDQIAGKRRTESCNSDAVVLDYFSVHGVALIITFYPYPSVRVIFYQGCSSNQDSVSSVLHCYASSDTTDAQQNGSDFFLREAMLSRALSSHIFMHIQWSFCSISKLICPPVSQSQEGEWNFETIRGRLDSQGIEPENRTRN